MNLMQNVQSTSLLLQKLIFTANFRAQLVQITENVWVNFLTENSIWTMLHLAENTWWCLKINDLVENKQIFKKQFYMCQNSRGNTEHHS